MTIPKAIVTKLDCRLVLRINLFMNNIFNISECSFLKVYNTTEGLASLCEPHIDITNTSEAGCLQEACNLVNGGQNQYNVINFQ